MNYFDRRSESSRFLSAALMCGFLNAIAITPSQAQNLVPLLGVAQVSSGYGHACALTTGGGVKCWGNNEYGELGDGTTTNRSTPVDVLGLSSGVIEISSGSGYTCALTIAGGVKCWGDNEYGQLGDGTTTDRLTPVSVTGLTQGVTSITTTAHTCALTSSGGVKCWGINFIGQVGDGTTINRTTPVNVVGLSSGVTSISAGTDDTCALLSGGGAKCWGSNYDGELGDGTVNDQLTPVDVQGLNTTITAISAGFRHTCAVTAAGGVKCWGDNAYFDLGDPDFSDQYSTSPIDVSDLTNVVSLSTNWGDTQTCAVENVNPLGVVTCWGSFYFLPGMVNPYFSIGRDDQFVDAVSVSACAEMLEDFFCAITNEGGVKCLGGNNYGELGNGTTSNEYVTTAVDVLVPSDTIFQDGFDD